MVKANRYKLGAFVFVGIMLILIGFFIIGLDEYFEPKLEVMTVFRDSVEGLKVGSPVKYKGVSMGRVTRIAMREKDDYIDVFMIVYSSSMDSIDEEHDQIQQSSSESLFYYFSRLKEKGVRCSLQSSGITGGSFIEFDHKNYNRDFIPEEEVKVPSHILYIPSRPSHITAVLENVSKIAEELAKVNITGFFGRLDNVLISIDKKLNSKELTELIKKINKAADDVSSLSKDIKEVADKDKIHKIFDEISSTLESIRKLTFETKKFENNLSSNSNEIRVRLSVALGNLEQTLNSVSEFINNLDEDPASLIRGKNKPSLIQKKDE